MIYCTDTTVMTMALQHFGVTSTIKTVAWEPADIVLVSF